MKITIKNARLSFPDLFQPRPFQAGDPPKFKGTFLVPKDSEMAKAIDAALEAVAKAKWPKDWQKVLARIRPNPNKCCWQDGDTKSYAGYDGMMAFSASNKVRPGLFDRDKTPLVETDGKLYAGCYVDAIVELFAYDNSGAGISASLSGVRFVKDGEAFSGGRAASAADFEDLGVDESDDAFA